MNGSQELFKIGKNITTNLFLRLYKQTLTVILVLLLVGLGFFGISHYWANDTTAQVRNLILTELKNTDELTTVSQVGKATVTLQQKQKLWRLPVGDTNLVYEGIGKIRAGLNLTNIAVQEVDINKGFIKVTLPSPAIQDISLDVAKSNTLANYRHWFATKSSSELHEQAQRKAIATLKAEACENHILDAANINAEQLIRKILTDAQFQTIIIETQLPKSCLPQSSSS